MQLAALGLSDVVCGARNLWHPTFFCDPCSPAACITGRHLAWVAARQDTPRKCL